ncbi:MAG: hybrid sensor histidine kinase/response regulator [Anaerolineae bacterium]|nr:hybrid sensor histidine kinase/response regulator [Anaerolineae bacterium]
MSVTQGSKRNFEELRSRLSERSAILLICISGLLMWLDLTQEDFPTMAFWMWGGFLLLGLITRKLAAGYPALERHLLVWGTTLGLAIAMIWSGISWPAFLVLPLILVSSLLIPCSHLIVASVIGLVAVWHPIISSSLPCSMWTYLLLLTVCVLLAWMISSTLYTALQWAWTMQQRADEMLELARDRQGDLNRMVKSLELAYATQRRTQRELYFARKQAEEARHMKEQFAANVSHELRTPLNLILGFSEVMYFSPEIYEEINWTPPLRQDIYHIYRSSRHLSEMINDILDLSRIDFVGFSLNKEQTALGTLLHNAAEIAEGLFRGKSVAFKVAIPDDLPVLDIDRTRIRQILLNLLSNAQRFTIEGEVTLIAELSPKEVLITVSDTGAGIPADKLTHIFEEFYQVDHSLRRRHDGAGLGLAICKRFVEAHGGRIWVESRNGIGSIFAFTLPLPDSRAESDVPSARPVEMSWPEFHPCILVVDPDPGVATTIERHIPGYDIVQVGDPKQLFEEIEIHHPQAVICNVSPGKHFDAVDHATVPVPFIECSLPSQAWMADSLKVAACLTKPITPKDLLNEANRLGQIDDILIIDDDRGFCRLIDRVLQASGKTFKIRFAYDGKDGLATMRAHRPDLVLLDLIMPEVDGFEVLAKMSQDPTLIDIPVILLTATSFVEDVLSQHNSRIVIHRSEGMRPAEVLNCLQALVGLLEVDYGEQATPIE